MAMRGQNDKSNGDPRLKITARVNDIRDELHRCHKLVKETRKTARGLITICWIALVSHAILLAMVLHLILSAGGD